MGRELKTEFGMSKKTRIGIFTAIAVFLFLSVIVFESLQKNIRSVIMEESEKDIENISSLNADAVYKDLMSRQRLLKSIADSISKEELQDYGRLLAKMKFYSQNYEFYNMGVLTRDGVLHTTTGNDIPLAGVSPYSEALEGRRLISRSVTAADGGERKVNILSEPVYEGTELAFVLAAAYLSSELASNLNISAIGDKGFSFIVDSQGKGVIYPRYGSESDYLELLGYVDGLDELSPRNNAGNHSCFWYEGEQYFSHFAALGINDWYLMTCAKASDVFAGARNINVRVLRGMGFLWIVICLSVGFIIYSYFRYQRGIQRIVFEDRLLQEKNFDYLRVLFPRILEEEREKSVFFALDVDKFKEFNLIYGGKAGDRLLKYIDGVFREELPKDRLYRYVADQFTGLLSCQDEREAGEKIEKILARFGRDIEKKEIQPFEVSVGLCHLKDYESLQVLHSDALIAKNTVKGSHVQKYAFYDERMRRERLEFMAMESAFQDALRNGEFQVYYQPKFDIRTGRIIGSEALARWMRPDGSVIAPAAFIPCFEANGQIVLLDEIILEIVCRQMKEMERDGIQVQEVSVNLSRVHLKYPGITEKISQIIRSMGIDASKLAFEITESAMYEEKIPLRDIVSELHGMGCRVNMDDYGTGVSGPSSLADIEFDVVKMDKSFIDKIGNGKMQSVIHSTIRLSEELGMTLLAEGVEKEDQVEWLKKCGCYFVQGFYYSRPVSETEYRRMLMNNGG
ncbi:MAG: GGDEF domain-containing protein [Eubacteriales bacterium]|nr:GGDEF domain-containing protein [Eubacteriales bacterium]